MALLISGCGDDVDSLSETTDSKSGVLLCGELNSYRNPEVFFVYLPSGHMKWFYPPWNTCADCGDISLRTSSISFSDRTQVLRIRHEGVAHFIAGTLFSQELVVEFGESPVLYRLNTGYRGRPGQVQLPNFGQCELLTHEEAYTELDSLNAEWQQWRNAERQR